MGNHNHFFIDHSRVWQAYTKQVSQHTFGHVANICRTFLHVWIIFHIFKESDEHVCYFFQTCFSIHFFCTNCFFNLTNHFWVRKYH